MSVKNKCRWKYIPICSVWEKRQQNSGAVKWRNEYIGDVDELCGCSDTGLSGAAFRLSTGIENKSGAGNRNA